MFAPGDALLDLRSLGELEEGSFLERPNRFVALAEATGRRVRVHVADTGRLEEILTPGRRLLLLRNRPGMKTDFTLIAAAMEEGWVLINSRLHRPIGRKMIEGGVLGFLPQELREEVSYGRSRFDYRADGTYVELKGCSLVVGERCLFPNAPTERGRRHLEELIRAREEGFDAVILILAVRPCECFAPHPLRDPAFRRRFVEALERGVEFRGFFLFGGEDLFVRYAGELSLCEEL